MRFAILGPLEVHNGDEQLRVVSPLQQLLLAVLIARGGRPVPADTLMDTLWGGNPPGDARKALGWHMHTLRKALGGKDHIVHNSSGYVLRFQPGDVDAIAFETLLGEATANLDTRPETAVRTLDTALRLWRGPAYADFTDTPMLRDEANRLEELRLSTLEKYAAAELDLGHHTEVTVELNRLVTENPYRERFREQLMLALYRSGRQAEALEVYRQGQVLVADNLGLDPGPVLRRLQQRILNGDPELDAPLPGGAAWQRPATVVPQQLPADISAFTGRATEVAQLLHACRQDESTMVTALDGMAGVGKTTLAVHIAHQLAPQFPDGQLFIDLHGFSGEVAPVTAAEALDRLLRALGVDAQQIPGHIDDRAALFRSVVSGKRVLLLLDNAASEQQVRPLLPGTTGNLALVTSRRRFGELDDARLVSLGLLSVEHGVDFFVRAAGLDEPDPERLDLVGKIVEQCGRLPLAIRIAAHQLRRRSSWTLAELHQRLSREGRRLETLSVRDRSVSAAFHISYQDLDPAQQRTFRLLSVFPQPEFDSQAAATVADVPLYTARHQLDDMVDAHLLDSPRAGVYTFHDLMRQFASAASRHVETDTGREAASFRLLDSYRSSAFAESAKISTRLRADPRPGGVTHEPPTGDVDFAPDGQPSLEATIGKAIELGVDTHMWQIGDVARELATDRSRPELLTLLERATRAAEAAGEPLERAVALNNLAATQLLLDRYPDAIDNFERSLRTRQELGDVRGQAAVLNSLGVAHNQLGNLDDAAACFDRAMSCAFQAGADATEAHAITNYVILADYLDMHEQALPLLNRARDIFSRNAHPRQQARLSFCFGVVYGGVGQPDRALKHLHRARVFAERMSEHFDLSHVLTAIAVNQRRLGNHADAIVNHRKAIRAGALADDQGLKARNLIEFGRTRLALREYDAALDNFRRGATLAVAATYRYEQARAEHGLADCHQALGDMVKAEAHLRECVGIYTDVGAPVARELRKRLATRNT